MKKIAALVVAICMLWTSTVIAAEAQEYQINATANGRQASTLETIVITGKTSGEERHKSTATVRVIDEAAIKRARASSVAELLSTSLVVGLLSWTPGQTSFNIRGGVGDGQGRDFKSQVLVLVNGRRAGTTNLSKLSPNEVKRIEIMRGPASVMYGSQAIGGIINLIMKDGRNTEGGFLDVKIGSSGLIQTHAEYATIFGESGELATYFGGTWGSKDDYDGGKGAGTQVNTHWSRKGGLGDLSWQINENNDVQLTLRSDEIYNVGFRGAAANRYANDDRINQSVDLVWNFESPDLPIKWVLHNYMVYDEDHLKWSAPRNANPANGTIKDFTKRKLYIMGLKFMPIISLSDTNDLLLGVDWEHSKLRSDRDRIRINGDPWPINPMDLNQTENVFAFYAEDTQYFFDERLTLRGGFRYTRGEVTSDDTPHLANQVLATTDYDKITWSFGVNFSATDNLFLRAGAATGFRTPTVTEMRGQVSNILNEITNGNPDIAPESNLQYEVGMFLLGEGWYLDLALFHNEIKDRIALKRIKINEFMSFNGEGKVKMTGVEFDSQINIDELISLGNWQLAFGLVGNYNFNMTDEDAKNKNRDEVNRVFKYQGSIYTQFGKGGTVSNPWSVRLTGILRGPMYWDTPEALIRPQFEPNPQFVHEKSSFMVWNLNGELELNESWSVYGGINNLFDKNGHVVFVAIDDGTEYLSDPNDGGYGTSMPGREFYLGLQFSF